MTKLTDYKPLTRNPNKGTQRGTGILEQSVRELGAGRSILVDKNGVILAGNHAQEAFINSGIDDVIEIETDGKKIVVVKRTDLDADSSAGKKMAIMDNRTSEQGLAWDAVVVEDLLNEIKQDEGELDAYLESLAKDTGAQIGDEPPEDAGAQIDKAEELRVKWGVELGQLWQLGEHRLICGDCTDKAVVDRLMDGEQYDFLVTSPPYNVGVQYDEHDDKQVDWSSYEIFLRDVLDVAISRLKDGRAIAWNIGTSPKTHHVRQHILIESYGLTYYRQMVWKKVGVPVPLWYNTVKNPVARQFTPNYQHEIVLIFTKGKLEKGESILVDDLCTNDVFEFGQQFATTDLPEGKTRTCAKSNLTRRSMKAHPAAFPVRIPQMFISHLSGPDELVYEPFLGSGTTIIACESLNRKCRAVEISPAYCAVAIQRWVDVTGQEPVLLTP